MAAGWVRGLAVEPELAGQRGVGDRDVAHGVVPLIADGLAVAGDRGVVVRLAVGEHLAQWLVVDEAVEVEVGEVADRLQERHVLFSASTSAGLSVGSNGGAAGAVVEVDDLLRQAAAFGDDFGGLQRVAVEEVGGLELGLQERVEDLGMLVGEVRADDDAVEGGKFSSAPS